MKTFIRPNTTGPSAGVITDTFVFTAASAIDPTTMKRVPEADTIHGELKVILDRIAAVLAEADLTLQDLTKITVWLSEEQYRFEFIPAYVDLMPGAPYASRGLFTIGLPGDCRLQVDVVAARRKPVDEAYAAAPEVSYLTAPFSGTDLAFSTAADTGDLVYADASALDHPGLSRVAGADSIAEETNIALDRLEQTLAEAGLTLADVVKVNSYLADDSYRKEFWAAFDARFAPGPNPVRLTQVCDLAGDARVLLDVTAAR